MQRLKRKLKKLSTILPLVLSSCASSEDQRIVHFEGPICMIYQGSVLCDGEKEAVSLLERDRFFCVSPADFGRLTSGSR